MSFFLFSIQQTIQTSEFEELEEPISNLYPSYLRKQYIIHNIFPPDAVEIDIYSPDTLLLVYSQASEEFWLALPETLVDSEFNQQSSFRINYTQVDEEDPETISFEWFARVQPHEEVLGILESNQENVVLAVSVSPSTGNMAGMSASVRYCIYLGCSRCLTLSAAKQKWCRYWNCCR